MEENLSADIVTLIDDEGIEREFEVLDFIENSQGKFYALMPNFDLPDEKALRKSEFNTHQHFLIVTIFKVW